jgi:hypothetical protein
VHRHREVYEHRDPPTAHSKLDPGKKIHDLSDPDGDTNTATTRNRTSNQQPTPFTEKCHWRENESLEPPPEERTGREEPTTIAPEVIGTKKSIGMSPFQLVYDTHVILPINLSLPLMKLWQDVNEEPNDLERRINEIIEVQQNNE